MWNAFGWHFDGKNPFDKDHWYHGWRAVSPAEAYSLVCKGRHKVCIL